MLLVTGTANPVPQAGSCGSQESMEEQRSRLVVFDLSAVDELNLQDIKLEKFGDWQFNGPHDGAGLTWETDGNVIFQPPFSGFETDVQKS